MRVIEKFLCESEIEGGVPYERQYFKFEEMNNLISQLKSNNPDLKEVKFTNNYLDMDDLSKLASALIKNTVLQKLMFVDMVMSYRGFLMYLLPALHRNTSLICLVFNMVKMFYKPLNGMEESLAYRARHLSNEDATCLFMESAANPTLECLVIRGGSLGRLGTKLNDVLKKSLSLRKVDLTDNKITNIGPLRKTIESNTGLKILILADNKIGNKAIRRIAQSLQKNSTLEKLWLQGNPIGNAGATRLVDAMQLNQSLRELSILKEVNPSIRDKIAQACAKNQKKFEEEKRMLCESLNISLSQMPYVLINIITDYYRVDFIQEERINTTFRC